MAIQIKKALIPQNEVSAPLLDAFSIACSCQMSSTNCIFDVIYELQQIFCFDFA